MSQEFVLVSDLHSNYPALKKVVELEGRDKEYIVLGDIVGLLSYPKKTVELVRSLSGFKLIGNHDKALFHHGEGHVNSDALSRFELEHTLSSLSADDCEYMSNRPFMEVVQRGPSRIALCHAYPWPAQASGYEPGNAGISKGSVTSVASTVSDDYDYVFHGHTHTQYELDCSQWGHDVHFVNPGSLGYDGVYAVVDTDSGAVELNSVELDMDGLREHIGSVLPDDAPNVNRWL